MDTTERQELRTIWHNLEVAQANRDWAAQDRANQRLATLLMDRG